MTKLFTATSLLVILINSCICTEVDKGKLENILSTDFNAVIPRAESALSQLQKTVSKYSGASNGKKLKELPGIFQTFANVYNCFTAGVSGIVDFSATLSNGGGFMGMGDINIPTNLMDICFDTLREASTTAGQISKLFVQLKAMSQELYSDYKQEKNSGTIGVTGNLANGFQTYFRKIEALNGQIGSSLDTAIEKVNNHKGGLGFGGGIMVSEVKKAAKDTANVADKVKADFQSVTEYFQMSQLSGSDETMNIDSFLKHCFSAFGNFANHAKNYVSQMKQFQKLIPDIKLL